MAHSTNFLHDIEPALDKKRDRKKKRLHLVLSIILFLLVAWLVMTFVAAGLVFANSMDAMDELSSARDDALELHFSSALEHVKVAEKKFESAQRGFVFLVSTKYLPWVGGTARQVESVIDSGSLLIASLKDAFVIAQDLVQLSGLTDEYLSKMKEGLVEDVRFQDLPTETKQSILKRLSASSSDLELLSARLRVAQAEFDVIFEDTQGGPFFELLKPARDHLKKSEGTLELLSVAARVLPELAGLEEEKTHLLLFLNNHELRPGGGFIGTYGIVKTKNAEITYKKTADSYLLDSSAEHSVQSKPPAPLSRYNATNKWFFRDANWSPDFAQSSIKTLTRFSDEVRVLTPEQQLVVPSAPRVDMVIGLTPRFVSSLLALTGPVQAGDQVFDADNFADKLEYQVEVAYALKGVPQSQRKEILADLVTELQQRMYSMSLSEWLAMTEVARDSIVNKQLMLYSTDQKVEEVLSDAGWGGRVLYETFDAQMVVDANLASLKSDPVVKRDIQYEIQKNDANQYIGRTTITYNHLGAIDWKTTRYRTYTRLYVPVGSQLIKTTGSLIDDKLKNPQKIAGPVDVGQDLNMGVFGAFTSVEPGQTQTLMFEYALAPSVIEAIENGRYDLTVLKQLGSFDHTLTLDLDFDKNVSHASPAEAREDWGDKRYELNTILDQDKEIVVRL